jgi:peptide/nickel transport system substrate-binding protein
MSERGEERFERLFDEVLQGRLTRSEVFGRAARLGLSFTALSTLLAACDSDEGGGSGQSSEQSGASGEIKRGGRIRVATRVASNADSLDPAHTSLGLQNLKLIYDTLTRLDSDFKPVPRLAEEWEVSRGGRQWTFRLVEGATWHDGKPVTADDVVFTYKRLLNPKEGAVVAASLEFMDPAGIKALDKRTVRFDLPEPYVDLAASVGVGGTEIVPSTINPKTVNSTAIGSGPFKLDTFTPGGRGRYVRNEDYHGEGYPFVDEIEVVNIFDESARSNALISGEVDLVPGIDFASVDVLESGGASVLEIPGGTFVSISLVQDMEPWTDQRVREALALAIDREEIVAVAFRGKGKVGNDQPISDAYPYAPEGIPQRTRDVDRAKELLAEAGHPDGLEATLFTSDAGFAMVDVAVMIAEQAKEAGFDIKINKRPPDTYWSEVWLKKNFYVSFWTGHPTPDELISLTLRSDSPQNEPHFFDKEFDALMEEAQGVFDEEERVRIYSEAFTRVHEACSWIIPGTVNMLHGVASNLQWEERPNSQQSVYLDNAWLST